MHCVCVGGSRWLASRCLIMDRLQGNSGARPPLSECVFSLA